FDPDDAWGAKQRHHVSGTMDGLKIRGPLATVDGQPALLLPAGWLRDCPLEPGRIVEVRLAPEGPQLDGLDPDIAAALTASPVARAFFESLAQFYRKAYLKWLDGAARRPEVRAERVREFVALLQDGKKERPK